MSYMLTVMFTSGALLRFPGLPEEIARQWLSSIENGKQETSVGGVVLSAGEQWKTVLDTKQVSAAFVVQESEQAQGQVQVVTPARS